MSVLRYLSHADVIIDPNVPVPNWSLSETGRRRTAAMLDQPWVAAIGRIVASAETKAADGAGILADHLGLTVETRPASGETDRSATGYVSHERHEELANRFFAHPDRSADGWETADQAKARVVDALADLLTDGSPDEPDVAVVGHGGVGTLLYCHLAGLAIDRRHDQEAPGHYWSLDRTSGVVLHPWRPIDEPNPTG